MVSMATNCREPMPDECPLCHVEYEQQHLADHLEVDHD